MAPLWLSRPVNPSGWRGAEACGGGAGRCGATVAGRFDDLLLLASTPGPLQGQREPLQPWS